jgi:hypothetical protein
MKPTPSERRAILEAVAADFKIPVRYLVTELTPAQKKMSEAWKRRNKKGSK